MKVEISALQLLSTADAAKALDVAEATRRIWRSTGRGDGMRRGGDLP